jgi:predicted acylesterase/phospholipase RssA
MLENLCGAVSESYLLRCVVASTSIPGVFPSQRIPLYRVEDGVAIAHDFVDGGVLNNAPVHIAIDAGATHVLSFELNPLLDRGPLHASTSARGGEPRLVGNLVRTFETLLDMATDEDIRGAAAWNRRIRDAEQGGIGAVGLKKHVPIFRVAPVERRVDTIEFDGHYETIFGGASPGLVAWAEQGYTDASARRLFWAATFEAFPEDPPPGP